MAKYLKLYFKYKSDIYQVEESLKGLKGELEMKLIEGEDNLEFDDIKI